MVYGHKSPDVPEPHVPDHVQVLYLQVVEAAQLQVPGAELHVHQPSLLLLEVHLANRYYQELTVKQC